MKDTLLSNLKKSAEDIGQLYPVLVDADTGEVLDGKTRLKADPNWRRELVTVEDPLKKLKLKYHANWHRKTINRKDVLAEIAEETGWRGLEPFAKFLGVSERTISSYLPEKYKLKHDSPHNLKTLQLFKSFNFDFSVWEAAETRPEGYGSKDFRGNCCPTVIYGLLSQYASQDDVIFDPMAGSGTFIDVAKEMGFQNIIARDVRPMRADIDKGDAEKTELPNESIDFIFAHFPYWKLIQYTEDDPNDLSRLTFDEYIAKTKRIFIELHRILRKSGFCAIMIGNTRNNGLGDLEAKFSEIGTEYFTLWDKIIKQIRTWKPETCGQRMGLAMARAKARKSTVINHDTLLVFRKD
jgi:hypothetical protein